MLYELINDRRNPIPVIHYDEGRRRVGITHEHSLASSVTAKPKRPPGQLHVGDAGQLSTTA